jgi:hypothetical protein
VRVPGVRGQRGRHLAQALVSTAVGVDERDQPGDGERLTLPSPFDEIWEVAR